MHDLIIIGGGPAGYNAALRAAEGGLKTLLFEAAAVGGVCLNEGCIPAKTLLYSAKLYDNARYSQKYGVYTENASMDHSFVINRKNKIVKKLTAGVASKLKKAGVELIKTKAYIQGKDNNGYTIQADGASYTSRYLLICTGSSPIIPPIPGAADGIKVGYVLTSREILSLNSVPETLTVIGGGVIGIEMASYYNSAGTKVTVIEALDHIAGNTDKEISDILKKDYEKKGVEFKLNARVTSIQKGCVTYTQNGEYQNVNAEMVLLSVGRRANTEGLGLENIGVRVERGAIITDEYGCTSVANVYAAGDVNGKYMLAHAAYREGEVCVNNMLNKKDIIDYNIIPSVIYTSPEEASVGETPESASAKGIDFNTISLSLNYSGRYMAENEAGDGICKIVYEKKNNRIIGVHMIGSYASEIIYGAGLMINNIMRLEDVQKLVFPHPTVGEVIRDGVFMNEHI